MAAKLLEMVADLFTREIFFLLLDQIKEVQPDTEDPEESLGLVFRLRCCDCCKEVSVNSLAQA